MSWGASPWAGTIASWDIVLESKLPIFDMLFVWNISIFVYELSLRDRKNKDSNLHAFQEKAPARILQRFRTPA